jgi:hypothetical protein
MVETGTGRFSAYYAFFQDGSIAYATLGDCQCSRFKKLKIPWNTLYIAFGSRTI